MPVPDFSPGEVLTAAAMDSIGLWLVKTQTVGSGVPSVTVSDAFSTTYDNYRVIYSGGTGSANTSISIQLGTSNTGYYGFLTYGDIAATTVLGANINNAASLAFIGGQVSGQATHASIDILGPFKAAYTKFFHGTYQNSGNYGIVNGEHRVATSYTAFTLTPASGTLTGGTIRVYGYRN